MVPLSPRRTGLRLIGNPDRERNSSDIQFPLHDPSARRFAAILDIAFLNFLIPEFGELRANVCFSTPCKRRQSGPTAIELTVERQEGGGCDPEVQAHGRIPLPLPERRRHQGRHGGAKETGRGGPRSGAPGAQVVSGDAGGGWVRKLTRTFDYWSRSRGKRSRRSAVLAPACCVHRVCICQATSSIV